MIASGLCMMGGCFAMDGGAAVETYWPARTAEFSPAMSASYATVLTVPIRGGDAKNDFCSFKSTMQNNNVVPDWSIAMGVNRDEKQADGRIYITAHNIPNGAEPAGLWCSYGGNTGPCVYSYEPEEIAVTAWNGSCVFERTGGEQLIYSSDFSLEDDSVRNVYVRSVSTRIFNWFMYRNTRTNVRFYICAMKSASGASAVFTDYDMTLVEV